MINSMCYRERIEVHLNQLNSDFFKDIVAYGFAAPSRLDMLGTMLMISKDGITYQFSGDYHRDWKRLFPVLQMENDSGWKKVHDTSVYEVFIRTELYTRFMENLVVTEKGIDFQWKDCCIKIILLSKAKSEVEIEEINRKFELRKPLFREGELVIFEDRIENRCISSIGIISKIDILRVCGKIEQIKYNILGSEFGFYNKEIQYEDIDEGCIRNAHGNIRMVCDVSGFDKYEVYKQMKSEYPQKYIYQDMKKNTSEVIFEIYDKCFRGKNAYYDMNLHNIEKVKKKYPQIISIFLLPPSFDELFNRLRDKYSERVMLRRKLEECFHQLEEIKQFDYIIKSESVNKTAYYVDMVYDPIFNKSPIVYEKEIVLANQIMNDIKKYLNQN